MNSFCHRSLACVIRQGALLAASTSLFGSATAQTPLSNEWSYQGQLKLGGLNVNNSADFQFTLWNASSGGAMVGSMFPMNNVSVADGLFAADLDFGSDVFNGDMRWLQIAVRSPAGSGAFTTLNPRQAVTAVPYALQTRGFFVNGALDVGVGTLNPLAQVHVVAEATPDGIHEGIFRTGVSDSAGDFFQIINGTGDNGQYIPILWGHHQTDARETLQIVGSSTAARDTGTRPLVTFDTFRSDGVTLSGSILNRPLFAWNNGGSRLMTMSAVGRLGIGTINPVAPLHIANSLPSLSLQDIDSTGAAQTGYLSFRDSSGAEQAWFGYGDTSTTDLTIRNHLGDIVLSSLGNVGIGTAAPQAALDVAGTTRTRILEITGADLAEKFPTSEEVQPGMVVAIDPANPGQLCLARGAYNRGVAGVVSGANNFSVGAVLGNLPGYEDAPPVALSGRVYVFCDATSCAIEPGDLLTSAETPGHAMKATDERRRQGAVIGKAMTALAQGERGLVLVLVSLQ